MQEKNSEHVPLCRSATNVATFLEANGEEEEAEAK